MEKTEKTPESLKQITARYPSGYILQMISFTVISILALFVVLGLAPADQKAEASALLFCIAIILGILSFGFKRYKIVLDSEKIIEVPIIGRKKQILLAEIESVIIRRSKAISVSNGKKKIYIDPSVPEYAQIFNMLSELGLL